MIEKSWIEVPDEAMRTIRDTAARLRGEYMLNIADRFGPVWAGGSIMRTLVKHVYNPDVDVDIFVPASLWHKGLESEDQASLEPYVDVPGRGALLSSKRPPFNFIKMLDRNDTNFPMQVFAGFDFFASMVATDGSFIYGHSKAFRDINRRMLVLQSRYWNMMNERSEDAVSNEWHARVVRQRRRVFERAGKFQQQLGMKFDLLLHDPFEKH